MSKISGVYVEVVIIIMRNTIVWIAVIFIVIFVFLMLLSTATPMKRDRVRQRISRETYPQNGSAVTSACSCEEGCPCKELHGDHGTCSCVNTAQKAATYCICDASCPCKELKCGMNPSQCPCRIYNKVSNKTSSRSPKANALDAVLEQRAHGLINAWKDTLSHRMLNTTDMNVMYDMWYSNMARRGMAPLYATEGVFQESMPLALQQQLSLDHAKVILMPYVGEEAKKCQPIGISSVCNGL